MPSLKLLKKIRKTRTTLANTSLTTQASLVNWSYAKESLLDYFASISVELNKQPFYRFRACHINYEEVQQIVFIAHKEGRVPKFQTKSNGGAKQSILEWEQEKPAQLIFSLSNMGTVTVLAELHSSSNMESATPGPILLAHYNETSSIEKDVKSRKINKIIHTFLRIQADSSYGNRPSKSSARFMQRLRKKELRLSNLYNNTKEQMVDEHRANVSLGIGLCSALTILVLQDLSKTLFPASEGARIAIVAITSLVVLTILARMLRRA